MSKEPNNIDRLVREKLDGLEMTPPPSVWKNTSASLNSKKKRPFFLWFIMSVAVVAALGTGIYFFSTQTDKTQQLAVSDSSNQDEKFNSPETNTESTSNSKKNTDSSTDDFRNDEATSGSNSADENSANDSFGNTAQNGDGLTDGNDFSLDSNGSRKTTFDKERSQKDLTLQGDSNEKKEKDAFIYGGQSVGNSHAGDKIATVDHSDSKNDKTNSGDTRNISNQDDSDPSNKSPDERTNSRLRTNRNAQNHLPTSIDLKETVEFGSLPPRPAEEFASEQPSIIPSKIGAYPLRPTPPFWKAFSLEAALGVSTFNNHPKKTTPTNLLNILNATASREQSVDFRFGVNYHLSNRFSIQSGVHFNASKEDYSYNKDQLVTTMQFDTISFTVDTTTFDTTFVIDTNYSYSTVTVNNTVTNSYRLLTVPFQFAWSHPISTRGSLELAAGGAISVFGRNSGTVIDTDSSTIGADIGYKTTGLLSLGGSIKYLHRFGNHHSVYIEPWAQFGITNQSNSPLPYESLRRRYGIRVGYRFYF